MMKTRVPLQIIEDRLFLTTVIECKSLRIHKHIIEFVIDTGSPNSYLSDKDVRMLQIPIKNKISEEEVDFGGSRYKQISLPDFKTYILKEGDSKECVILNISLQALKTTKLSDKKIKTALMLPSILGMDFLKSQELSLHVIMTENLAYLELER